MSAPSRKKVTVRQNEEEPVEVEVLAQAIVDIGKAAKRLAASRLNRKAVIVLLAHQTGIGQTVISNVLDGIEALEADYLRPATKRS
jgi:hypothetical protein